MMDVDWASGNIYIRPRDAKRGHTVAGHRHNFAHTHLVQSGWWLVRGWIDGKEVTLQKASIEYQQLRSLRHKYEPESLLRPIRFPDRVCGSIAEFNVHFIAPNEPIPAGGTEIIFAPQGYHCLIHANTLHDMIALDDGHGLCIYSHREPQGDITHVYNGWTDAYV